jgi:hypothetical protein
MIAYIGEFLSKHLQLELHPQKIILRKLSTGVDFIGYIFFAHHILLRTRTKKRMHSRLKAKDSSVKGLPGEHKADIVAGIVIVVVDGKARRRETHNNWPLFAICIFSYSFAIGINGRFP